MSHASLESTTGKFLKSHRSLRSVAIAILFLFLVSSPSLIVNASASTATGITIDVLSVSLRTGETFQLKSSFIPSGSTGGNVVWSSTSPRVASVSNGLVTALGPGVAKISASTEDGKLGAQATVTVSPGLALTPTFGLATWKANGFSVPISNFDASFRWEQVVIGTTSMKTPRASLLSSGVIEVTEIDNSSEVTLEVRTSKSGYDNGSSSFTGSALAAGEKELKIRTPVTSVSLNTSIATFAAGTTLTVEAVVAPANATDKKIIWSTSNPRVATVVDGKVTGTGVGNAVIQARSRDGGLIAKLNLTLTTGQALVPKFGLATYEGEVVRVKVDNFDSTYSWVPSILATTGKSKPSVSFSSEGYLTIRGMRDKSSISVQLAVSKQGFEQSGATYDFVSLDPYMQYLDYKRSGAKVTFSLEFGKLFANQKVTLEGKSGDQGFSKLFIAKLDVNGKVKKSVKITRGSEVRISIFGLELPALKIK